MTPSTRTLHRDHALDMVKGFLVIAMAAYHGSEAFLPRGELQQFVQHTLHFVSGSWIFISGLIISMHYREAFQFNPAGISRRLVIRGIKLLLIVTLLNIVIRGWLYHESLDNMMAPQTLWNMYIVGDARRVSFEILIGIGYLLMVAPVFLWHRTGGLVLALVFVAGGMLFQFTASSRLPSNAWMLVCGLGGLLAGIAAAKGRLMDLANHSIAGRAVLILTGVAAALYLALPGVDWPIKNRLVLYVPGIATILLFLYLLAVRLVWHGWCERALVLMAHYSLVSYIGQMLIIFSLRNVTDWHRFFFSYPMALTLTVAMLLLGISLLDAARKRYTWARSAYDALFS